MCSWKLAIWAGKAQLYRSMQLFRVWQKTRHPLPLAIFGHTIPAWQCVCGREMRGQGDLLCVAFEYNGYLERPIYVHESTKSLRNGELPYRNGGERQGRGGAQNPRVNVKRNIFKA